MKVLRRFMAVFICVCMLIPNIGITSFAQEDTEITEETTETATSTDAEIIDSDYVEKQETAEDDTETTIEISDALPLNYVVIENDYVATPSTQYVVASIGNEGAGISDAVLTYINQTSGVSYTKSADKVQDFLVLFNLDFSDSSYAGQYKLVSISYSLNGVEYIINLDEQGIGAVFGVDTEVDITPTGWLVDEQSSTSASTESSDDVPGVIVNDVTKEDVSAADVEEALLENGFKDVKLEAPAYCYDENWNETRVAADPSSFIVVLDPGHGINNPGAVHTHNGITYVERDLNLKIAFACKAELEKAGVTVYMTRTTNDVEPTLTERAQIAANYGADLFVSIHNNSTTNASAMGAEVWVPNSSSYNYYAHTTGEALGTDILNNLTALGISRRGVYTRNATPDANDYYYPTGDVSDYYTVINESRRRGIPGIIIEHAYASNASDAANFLSSDAKLTALGQADAKGILEYIKSADESYRYKGVDYSAVYDYDYYVSHQPDVKAAYGSSKANALAHFVNNGMAEGRQAKEDFNVNYYMNAYPDLKAAFGTDLTSYYMHYIYNGKSEGRKGNGTLDTTTNNNSSTNDTTTNNNTVVSAVYNGVDYGAVYNYDYYISRYPDLKAAFGNDKDAALAHFVNCGIDEGRRGCENFDVSSYRNANYDLKKAYGNDLRAYYIHYINYGKNEGRVTTGVTEVLYPDTVYNGVDYSTVYDYNYYLSRYPDLKAAFEGNDAAALAHFVNNGMKEGRQGCSQFDVHSYKNAYQDLRLAFGNDLKQYYLHYIDSGKREGRIATGVSTLQNPLTKYKGQDYSLVYDFNYYLNNNPDIKAAYGEDEEEVLAHFVNNGMREGRQATAGFNVRYYKANYGDLTIAFGNNLSAYYIHYISDGNREKRVADRLLDVSVGYTSIMGDSNTTLNQMVAYYKSRATYPSFYADSDAPTIEAFCQIYIEECQAEGVRADVAFCQAMKETGFLKFGGQVQIEQYNFAGLGATDGGAAGASFGSVREGIRAHIQHLKAYASTSALTNACVDSRYSLVTRNSAPYVEWLGISENPYGKGWATAKGYGYSIINDYMAKLKQY